LLEIKKLEEAVMEVANTITRVDIATTTITVAGVEVETSMEAAVVVADVRCRGFEFSI
jgi:hypothetical protein